MIQNGNKVKYVGLASVSYIANPKGKPSTGKIGKVISDPYQLSTVPNMSFVDVKWDHEGKRKDDLLDRQPGHVVNIENLMVIS